MVIICTASFNLVLVEEIDCKEGESDLAGPDNTKDFEHPWYIGIDFTWEITFIDWVTIWLLSNDSLFISHVIWVGNLLSDNTENESTNAHAAHNDTTSKSLPCRKMTPCSIEGTRVETTFTDTKATAIQPEENPWVCLR